MEVTTEDAGTPYAEQIDPLAVDAIENQRSKPDIRRLGHPQTLILWNRVDRHVGNVVVGVRAGADRTLASPVHVQAADRTRIGRGSGVRGVAALVGGVGAGWAAP